MKSSGFTEAGLDRLRAVLSAHVEQAAMPSLIALVAREGGDAHVEVIGTRSFDDPEPLSRHAIFRIASLSKPIAAAAAMVLVEQGLLGLDDPVTEWLPELADRRVLRRIDGALDDTVPARRPITLDDFWAFVRMVLGGGVFEGRRVLSAEAVRLMTTDALTAEQRSESSLFLGTDGGWGLGMRVPAGTGAASELPEGLRMGRRHRHHMAVRCGTGADRHPVHPTGDDLPHPAGGGDRLLERHLRRPRRLRQQQACQEAASSATTGAAGWARPRWAPGRTMVAAASASLMVRASADPARATAAEARKAT
jgi:CubicO group peptidase (beta-lactamase class C family)